MVCTCVVENEFSVPIMAYLVPPLTILPVALQSTPTLQWAHNAMTSLYDGLAMAEQSSLYNQSFIAGWAYDCCPQNLMGDR